MHALSYAFTPGCLKVAETRLLYGRDFTWHDIYRALQVAIGNEAFARKTFGKTTAVGQPFLLWKETQPCEIVGEVEATKY